MQAVYSFVTVIGVIVAAAVAGRVHGGDALLLSVVAYAGLAVFLIGFCHRVVKWAAAPVPFRIPVTCGQQTSQSWIKSAALDNPTTTGGVLGRMALEVFLFRSLFRNSQARLHEGRLILSEQKYLWLAALAFHWSLLIILVRHLRLLVEPVPAVLLRVERVDGFFQLGTPPLYISDAVFACALTYLLLRRFRDPMVRYISQYSDYFALLVIAGIAASGLLMRYTSRVDVVGVKQFALGVAAFHPVRAAALGSMFTVHVALISLLAAYFPFSKLMHIGGVFLSPTRNLANNNRAKRHINPWNYPVKTHTYAEWEEEFRDKLRAAEIPLEADHAGRAAAD
jgi:nitrate reductase gamma subunit